MLTCEEIIERVKHEVSLVIRSTHREIADRIYPEVPCPTFWWHRPVYVLLSMPEYIEHGRAQILQTSDWTDMVVHLVTLWQFYAAYNARFDEVMQ